MKAFMDQDFLLKTPVAQKLYHQFAKNMPIIDYHCHISPEEIAKDREFDNIAQLWLGGDHYKWRQMRSNGIDEYYITGDATDFEKFEKWAQTLDKAIGNPLYHWSHLELKRYFGYEGVLNSKTVKDVWEFCNNKIREEHLSARKCMKMSNVRLICTTDDPADDLKWHEMIKNDETFDIKVLPAWRPDRAMNIEKPDWSAYIQTLSDAAQMAIDSFESLKAALKSRMQYFAEMGCKASDHGLEYVMYEPCPDSEVEVIFNKAVNGQTLSIEEQQKYKTQLLLFLGQEYAKLGWVMQLHYGCLRDNNKKMFRAIGADTGFDCINNYGPAQNISAFLNALNETDGLPKTILYSLNPQDNAMLGTLIGCFQNSDACGKIQQGAAWWFNDHKCGMRNQMISLANLGLLGNFIGMLTDSRSFLSYSRHEYFRRIMCDLIGEWVDGGEYPEDMELLGKIVENISYYNTRDYFGFDVE